ncbi:MAG TPA: Ig domain-containing protein [Terriglobales bacterium]|nr:Ig domain-containing protein [Terriglobales bacterium]
MAQTLIPRLSGRIGLFCFGVILLSNFAMGQAVPQDEPLDKPAAALRITSESLPEPVLQQAYYFQFSAAGGTPPLTWKVAKGTLPPGLELEADTGVIAGMPTSQGEFSFTLRVSDSGTPAQSHTRDFSVQVAPPFLLEWVRMPALGGNTISGAVKVANASKDVYDLTVIILAVNEIGKAFALGYQHFTLAQNKGQEIPFDSSLPQGTYIVHADAVAEIAPKNLIRRARLETPTPLVVSSGP